MLSDIIAQMDEDKFEVEYPAPIADGFHAPKVEAYRSTMYRVIQSTALPSELAKTTLLKKSVDVFPDLMHYQLDSIRHQVASRLLAD